MSVELEKGKVKGKTVDEQNGKARTPAFANRSGLKAGLALLGVVSLATLKAGCGDGSEDKIVITPTDAGPQESCTPGTDSGVAADSAVYDSGLLADAAHRPDRGHRLDSGHHVDSGHVSDSGQASDSAQQTDGGQLCTLPSGYFKFTGLMLKNTPQIVGGYVFTYTGNDPAGDALISRECGGNPSSVMDCHFGVPTIETDSANHRKITAKPIVSVGNTLNVQLIVEPSTP